MKKGADGKIAAVILLVIVISLFLGGPVLNLADSIFRSSRMIPNRALEKEIMEYIGFTGDELTPEDCVGITELCIVYAHRITDLEGLQYFTDLERLYVRNSNLKDLSALSSLPNLDYLDLSFNKISDLSPLANLPKLRQLMLVHNRVKDLSPISNIKSLRIVAIRLNPVAYNGDYSYLQEKNSRLEIWTEMP